MDRSREIVECVCLYANRHLRQLYHRQVCEDGTVWNIYRRCPVDGNPVVEVVDSPILRRHEHDEATAVEAVAVGSEVNV